jgi:peptide deformylase
MSLQPEKLQLILYPDPVLRRKAEAIESVTDQVRRVAVRMLQIMHEAPGVGLAGPQVGLSWRIFVTNTTGKPEDDRVFINPVLRDPSREMVDYEEGCLSLPGVTAGVHRPKSITVEALNMDGRPFQLTSDDLPARVWQHEFDHLEGVLILDKMAEIDKVANRQKLRDLEQRFEK